MTITDEIYDRLIDILLEIPGLQSNNARDAMVDMLPREIVVRLRRDNAPVVDLMLVVNQLKSIGQLPGGEWPAAILARAAKRFCIPGSELSRKLERLLAEFEPSFGQDEGVKSIPEIVVGTDDRLPIFFFEKLLTAQRAVARLTVPKMVGGQVISTVSGTGWLITPELLLTNYHFVSARRVSEPRPSPEDFIAQARAVEAWFGFDSRESDYCVYRSESVLQSNPDLDYAVLKIAASPSKGKSPLSEWGYLTCLKKWPELQKGDRLNIIQHARGEPKSFAIRSNYLVLADGHRIQYLTDTEPGASGSPVMDDEWRVVGLHRASVEVAETIYKGDIVKYNNQGTKIESVIEDLNADIRGQIARAQGWA